MLASAVIPLALLAAAPPAQAGGSVPPAAPTDDGSCETRPTSYPADGEPVPEGAGCTQIGGADGAVIGEVWSWLDADSVQWYNYAVSSLPPAIDGTVVMCGSTDPGAAGLDYICTAESTYLLFTVAGVFVEWPTTPPDALHFCEQVSFGTGSGAVVGDACSSVERDLVDHDPLGGAPPTQTPTAPTAPPSESPTAPPPPESPPVTSVPSDGAEPSDEFEDAAGEPTVGATGSAAVSPTEPGPQLAVEVLPSIDPSGTTVTGPAPTGPLLDPGPEEPPAATPVQGASVALVGGSRFPMGLVLGLAVALALGGYVMLAAPGLMAARRRPR